MKWFKWLSSLTLLVMLVCSSAGIVHADDPAPRVNPELPLPPDLPAMAVSDSLVTTTTSLNLPILKAVLIVGNIDGDYGSWTTTEVNNMKLAEAVLRANGVSVATFYPPNNDWAKIKAVAEGAHFLMYRGHGIEWNSNPLVVGGFALSNGSSGYNFISNDQIRADLHLATNAIVMLYGCYTAGSYGGEVNLTSAGAQDRVYQYSDPFFDIGAGGYFANWWGDAFEKFLVYLFAGQTLGQAYESYFDFTSTTVERFSLPTHTELAMWLDKDYYGGGWKYDNAFAGKPTATIETLFATQMVASPSPITYLATDSSDAANKQVTIDGIGSLAFEWVASLSDAKWADLGISSGLSGTSTTVTLDSSGLKPGTYEANLTVTTSTAGVVPNVQIVPVRLIVVTTLYKNYLPITTR